MARFDFESLIYDIPDFPKKGVVFKDVTPLLADPEGFNALIREIADNFRDAGVTKVVGAEARGFMIGAPVAYELGAGFVPARKPGKLPREVVEEEYALEYGTATLQVHKDSLGPGDRVIVVDDLVATGGTMVAQMDLVRKLGAELKGIGCLMALEFLHPREILAKADAPELFPVVSIS
jgi:adenine phosphoribosyltransferase